MAADLDFLSLVSSFWDYEVVVLVVLEFYLCEGRSASWFVSDCFYCGFDCAFLLFVVCWGVFGWRYSFLGGCLEGWSPFSSSLYSDSFAHGFLPAVYVRGGRRFKFFVVLVAVFCWFFVFFAQILDHSIWMLIGC